MMKIQSFGCQPLKPSYQMNSKQSFGSREHEDWFEEDFASIRKNREEMAELAKNKDSKFLSTIGTLGVGAAAGALSFFTFKTMAPKGWNAVKTVYNKIADMGFVKTSVKYVKDKAIALGGKIAKTYNEIKPDSRLGKIKTFITDKINWIKVKMSPVTKKLVEWKDAAKAKLVSWGVNKETIKEAAKNTGATLVAIPAAVTAVNSDLKAEEGEI